MKNGTLCLNRSDAIRHVLKKFNMSECWPILSPINQIMVELLRSKSLPISDVLNRNGTGSLFYIATCYWPDIAFTASTLAQFCKIPKVVHWMIAKCFFLYLPGTEGLSIFYSVKHGCIKQFRLVYGFGLGLEP